MNDYRINYIDRRTSSSSVYSRRSSAACGRRGYSRVYSRNCYAHTAGANVNSYIYAILRLLEKVLTSDGFAAAFCGLSFFLIIGVIGGIECGRLSVMSGIGFCAVLLGAVGVLLYRKNRE